VLQCVAVCCSALQCVAVRCSVLQCVAVCCSALQCVAVCRSVLQCAVSKFGAESVLQSLTACSMRVGLSSSVEYCSTGIMCIYVYIKIFVLVSQVIFEFKASVFYHWLFSLDSFHICETHFYYTSAVRGEPESDFSILGRMRYRPLFHVFFQVM